MKKEYGFHVTCPNDNAHEFPYVIEFEPDKAESKPRVFEVTCPYCKQVMTLPVQDGMKYKYFSASSASIRQMHERTVKWKYAALFFSVVAFMLALLLTAFMV